MFYLIQFFDSFKSHVFKGSMLTLTTVAVLVCAGLQKKIDHSLLSSYKTLQTRPYFHALLSSKENASRIQRKIVQLPGVKKVILLGEEKVKGKVEKMMEGLTTAMNTDLLNIDYTGLKIVLSEELRPRSISLIRDYMGRLVGKENLTLGSVKGNKADKMTKELPFFIKWGAWLLLGIFSCLWVVSAVAFQSELKKDAYLVEQFQRRTAVGPKSFSAGLLSLILVILPAILLMASIQWINFLIVSFIILSFGPLLLRQYQWRN